MASAVMSLVATSSSRIRELTIKNGQLIFLQDMGRIAFDFNNKRVFYNQIVELETEAERLSLDNPLGGYYFVLGTGVLWHFNGDWIQITEKPENILFIDVSLPQLGQENKLYINKADQDISVWDDEISDYVKVANYTHEVSDQDILDLFK